ncbi:MAG: NDP-sugar synthase [Nitrospirales bacterium]
MMKAMILAAGFGTRLRPLTNTVPKPLLPVGGIPLIVWNLMLLRAHGIRQVIINLHYLGHLIQEAIGNGAKWDMDITYSHEPDILGTGGGMKKALRFFENQPFLVINGDTLIDLDVQAFIAFHREQQGAATLVLRDDPDAERWGVVECNRYHRLLRINGKGVKEIQQDSSMARRMFAGVHILDPGLLQKEPEKVSFSIIETYTKALARGSYLFGFVHAGYWSDVGTMECYTQAQRAAESENFFLALRNQPGYT